MNKSLRSLALRLRASLPLNTRLAALCLLALLVCSAGLSSAVSGQDKTALRQEVDRALRSYDVLSLDTREVLDRVRQTQTLSLPTSAGTFDLVLTPHDILAPNYRATATGDGGVVRELARPAVSTYKGTVRGMKGAQARLTIDGETVEGMIITPAQNYFIEPASKFSPSAGKGDFVFYAESDVVEEKFGDCGVTMAEEVAAQAQRMEAGKGGAAFAKGGDDQELFGPSYQVELATEADFEYFQAFGSAFAANQNIITIINQVNGIYETQIGLRFFITHQHVWETANDPYTTDAPGGLLDQFEAHWNNNFGNIARDLAHLWTGKDLGASTTTTDDDSTIGIASQPGLNCANGSGAYGLSQNITNGSNQRRSLLTAHEIGHNINAAHTNGVTECDNTIMSPSLGTITQPSFCQLSRDQITDHSIQNISCLVSLVAPGCSYALSSSVQSFPAAGGGGSFNVSATGGCNWGVAEGANWITVTAGDSGSGSGAVSYTVAPNTGGPRAARINVAGQILTVTQQASAACGSTPVATGQTLNGTLGSPDCRSGQTGRVNAFIDIYTFGASAGQQARIVMNAPTPPPAGLDTYLYLYGPDGALIAENDDIVLGEQTNSRIPDNATGFLTLPATGIYTIVATSYDNDDTGAYTLALTGNAQPPVASTVQFSASSATVTEGTDRRVDITVTRAGDSSQAASVDYATSNVTASDRSDYLAAYGTLRWAAGDGSPKTFSVFIVDDVYGNTTTNGQSDSAVETFNVTLSNPASATLGATAQMQVSIANNETADGANPVKAATFSPAFFVRQHYLDFFNREPDASGL
ncbi:MAG TPA: M12 family metallo-peptidase, partial [Pyrinomonadaceae bacterium]